MKKILSLSVFLLLSTTLVYAQLPQGLISYYPFNGNLKDSMGNGSDGKASSNVVASTDRNGKANRAYSFKGGPDYITLDNNLSFENTTISCWVKTKMIKGQWQVLLSNLCDANVTKYGQFIELRLDSMNRFDVYIGTPLDSRTLTSKTALGNDKWTLVTVSVDNFQTMNLYINGKRDSSHAFTKLPFTTGTLEFLVGARSSPHSESPFTGSMDEVMFFDRVLNDSEITSIYDLTKVTSGIEDELKNGNLISVYPNPCNSNLFIQNNLFKGAVELSIFDVSGRKVHSEMIAGGEFNTGHPVNIENLPTGVYVLHCKDEMHASYAKFIKQ